MRALILLLLTACAVQPSINAIDHERAPPADWPALREIVIPIAPDEVRTACPMVTFIEGGTPASCARINFAFGTCAIYTASERADVLEHERAHCAGYDHPHESTLRNAWQRYKESTR